MLNQGALTAKPEISLQITFRKVLGQQQKYILKACLSVKSKQAIGKRIAEHERNMYVYSIMTAPKDRVKAEQEINKIIKANLPQELSQYFCLMQCNRVNRLGRKMYSAQTIRDNF